MYKRLDEINKDDFREKPGIYVFYYKPKIATYDLFENDDISGAEEMLKLINEKFITPMNSKKYSGNINLGYGSNLSGDLAVKNQNIADKNFSNQISKDSFNAKKLFSDFKVRSAFRQVIDELENDFSSPIYIGVSHNINERITEHRDSYFDAEGLISKAAQVSDENFGARAANFARPEELFVKAHYFDSKYQLTKKNAYELALVTEWVLQQQYKPVLGKK